MDDTAFDRLVEKSTIYLRERNRRLDRFFGIRPSSGYGYDLAREEIWWFDNNSPKTRAKVTVVGTLSSISGTWFWAWANTYFKVTNIGPIDQVRDFGIQEGYSKLTDEKWAAGEIDAWEMTSVSARLMESQGAFCSRIEPSRMFFLLDQVEFIPQDELENYPPLV